MRDDKKYFYGRFVNLLLLNNSSSRKNVLKEKFTRFFSVFLKSPHETDDKISDNKKMTKIYQELSPKINEKRRAQKRFLNVVDSCISFFVVTPLVVGFWKGIWNNINRYDDEYKIFPLWKWLTISYFVSTFIYYARDYLNDTIMNGSDGHVESIYLKGLRRAVIYRIYHYIFAFSCIMIWRCLWEIVPRYWGEWQSFIHSLIN